MGNVHTATFPISCLIKFKGSLSLPLTQCTNLPGFINRCVTLKYR